MSLTSSPKFPIISEKRGLVSVIDKKKSSDGKNVESKETLSFRGTGSGELLDVDTQILMQQVTRSFITALHQDSTTGWDHLYEVLVMVKPYSQLFQDKTQIHHYVERVRGFVKTGGKVPDKVINAMIEVFPNYTAKLYSSGNILEHRIKFPGPEESVSHEEHAVQPNEPQGIKIPREQPLITAGGTYVLENPKEKVDYFNPKPLCMDDLRQSLPAVVRELTKREAALGFTLGMTEAALDIDLSTSHIPTPPSTPKRSPSFPVLKSPSIESVKETSVGQEIKKAKDLRTGREIVELFVKDSFRGELKFAYLNHAPSQRYDPYNLIEVPKEKINQQEHFVISSHSILHVQANKPSESQPLADWYKEACQFQAISKIGFFKNFLIYKMFRKWKLIKTLTHYLKVEAWLERTLIHNVPSFGSALLRISGLLQELTKVTFLPFETNESYTLAEFEDRSFRTSISGRNYVKQFFDYCQLIVNMTQDNCFDYLHYCQAQVRRHVHNYREFLTVSKRKRMIRQNNLKLAREEVQRLGTFTSLVDQIIAANLLILAQSNVCRFVNSTMPGPSSERDGLFHSKLVFDKANQLVLSPSAKKLTHTMSTTLEDVLNSICNLPHAMKLSDLTESSKVRETTGEEQQEKVDVTAVFKESLGLSDSHKHQTEDQQSTGIQTVVGTQTDAEVEDDLTMMEAELLNARNISEDPAEGLCVRQENAMGLLVEGERFQQYGLIHSSPLNKDKLEAMLFHK